MDPDRHKEIWFDNTDKYLYLDFRECCNTHLKISTWNKGLLSYRWNFCTQSWEYEEWDPGIFLPLNGQNSPWKKSLQQFMADIPTPIKEELRFFQWRQFVILKLLRTFSAAFDLLRTNPSLLWLLVDTASEKELTTEDMGKLILLKRKQILHLAGGPEKEWAVKILSKIKPGKIPESNHKSKHFYYFSHENCDGLKNLIKNASLLIKLRYIKEIPLWSLYNINDHPNRYLWLLKGYDRLNNTIYGTYYDEETGLELIRNWSDCHHLGEQLRISNPLSHMRSCKSLESLRRLHDKWARTFSIYARTRVIQNHIDVYGCDRFPDPIINGNQNIIHISTIEELFDEARVMHNCVSSYAGKIMQRKSYIYKVLSPQRATLEIAEEDGKPYIKQLKLACNGKPSEELENFIKSWLNHQSVVKPD